MFDLAGYGGQIFSGTVTTVELSVLSLLVSFIIGLFGASAKLSKSRALRSLATLYTTIIRGVPDLVLMLLIFYRCRSGSMISPTGSTISRTTMISRSS